MLIGHAEQAAAFQAAARSGKLHHAWLLAGPQGIGKARFALEAATWVLAGRPDGPLAVAPDHPSARLVAAGSHMDFARLERTEDTTGKLRSAIRVDEVRALQPVLRGTPALGDWRVILVDAMDDMNRNASNAFLKNLEEPPPATLFLCVTHAPARLLPTIRSRCRTLRFHPLDEAATAAVIAAERPEVEPQARAALVRIARGAPGRALRFADDDIAGLEQAIERLATRGETRDALALARALSGRAAGGRYEAFLEVAPAAIASAAAQRQGPALARALALWEKASALAASAVPLALEPQAVSFELASLVAGLAE